MKSVYALVTDAYGGHGGIAVFNRDLLEAFCCQPGMEQVTATPRVISRDVEPLPKRLCYRSDAATGVVAYLLALLRDLPRIARADVIYCGHLNLAPLALLLGRVLRRPVLGALYGIEAWAPPSSSIAANAAKHFDHYYSISRYTLDRFRAWSGVAKEKISLLPNAIHLERYTDEAPNAGLAERLGIDSGPVLLTFGRLVSRERAKGFDEVLAVLPALVEQFPSLVYVIAGDGPYRSELEARARALGVSERVVFTGYVDENEKADLYRLADAFVMPSRGEGFGFVFLEAMACGAPVVASSADGSRDAVRDGLLGPMVDPDDAEALIGAIRSALKTPRAVPEGLDYFSYPRFVERTGVMLRATVAA